MSRKYMNAFPRYVIDNNLYYTQQVILYWLCMNAEDDGTVKQKTLDTASLAGMAEVRIPGNSQIRGKGSAKSHTRWTWKTTKGVPATHSGSRRRGTHA